MLRSVKVYLIVLFCLAVLFRIQTISSFKAHCAAHSDASSLVEAIPPEKTLPSGNVTLAENICCKIQWHALRQIEGIRTGLYRNIS